jgi:hypothetical protein
MGRTCNTQGKNKNGKQNFGLKTSSEKHHLGELGIDGRNILKCILQKPAVRVWNGFNLLKAGSYISTQQELSLLE